MTSADFAAAQRRVAERRAAREASRRSQQSPLPVPSSSQTLFSSTTTSTWHLLHSTWSTISSRTGTSPHFRVGQVDAELLDSELLELLKSQVGDALKYFGPPLRDEYGAEILLALRAILFKLTLWDHDASYGAALQNLRYADARCSEHNLANSPPSIAQKSLYGMISVFGQYAWTKWEDRLLDLDGGYTEPTPFMRRLSRLSSVASSTYSFAACASFLVFLVNGKYRTLLDRLLRLRLTSTTAHLSREVSFEYLNRQLVWHAFTEFLLFILPLVGIARWRRWLSRAWRKTKAFFSRQRGWDDDDEDVSPGGELHFLPERTCAICYQDQNPGASGTGGDGVDIVALSAASGGGVIGSAQTDITNPYEAIPCGCVYDFVCLAQRIEGEDGEGWVCLRCGELVKECAPWNGDVVEEMEEKATSGKSVSFAEGEKGDGPGTGPSLLRDSVLREVEPRPHEEDDDGAGIRQEGGQSSSLGLDESGQWDKVEGTSTPQDEEDTFDATASLVFNGNGSANAEDEAQGESEVFEDPEESEHR